MFLQVEIPADPLMAGRCWLHMPPGSCLQGTACWGGDRQSIAMGNEQGCDLCQGHKRAGLFLTAPEAHLTPGAFSQQDK